MKNNLLAFLIAFTLIAAARSRADVSYTAAYDQGTSFGGSGYVAVQGGLNLNQTFLDSTLITKANVGGLGGFKLGAALGDETASIRPAIELDAFYNGCSQDYRANVLGYGISGKVKMESGAFLLNGILNFHCGAARPYLGAGAGVYTGKLTTDISSGSYSSTGFAWQLLAGVNAPITSSMSIFTEYKFLNYMDNDLADGRFGQHLVAAGIRFYF